MREGHDWLGGVFRRPRPVDMDRVPTYREHEAAKTRCIIGGNCYGPRLKCACGRMICGADRARQTKCAFCRRGAALPQPAGVCPICEENRTPGAGVVCSVCRERGLRDSERRCGCGKRISIYNPDDLCFACAEEKMRRAVEAAGRERAPKKHRPVARAEEPARRERRRRTLPRLEDLPAAPRKQDALDGLLRAAGGAASCL